MTLVQGVLEAGPGHDFKFEPGEGYAEFDSQSQMQACLMDEVLIFKTSVEVINTGEPAVLVTRRMQ